MAGSCHGRKLSRQEAATAGSCRGRKLSGQEAVRAGSCHGRKLSVQEAVMAGSCQGRKLPRHEAGATKIYLCHFSSVCRPVSVCVCYHLYTSLWSERSCLRHSRHQRSDEAEELFSFYGLHIACWNRFTPFSLSRPDERVLSLNLTVPMISTIGF